MILLLFNCFKGIAQPKAAFTSTATAGCAPLVVQFKDASTGSPASYYWDLGNGITSTLQNPGALYTTPGSYNIKLVVKDAGGQADSVVQTGYINVYAKPVVDFSFNPPYGCAPVSVTFTDKSDPSSGTEAKWSWDFGDGQVSTDQNPVHLYTTIDTFSITLTVTNSFGCATTRQMAGPGVGGVANMDFAYTYNNACSPPTKVTFTHSTNANPSLSYQWDFGDGGTSSQPNPVYTYNTNGKYNVQLIVSTDNGCTDTVTKNLSIGTVSPNFIQQTGGCVNKQVIFQDSSSPSPVFLKWDFGDGATGTGLAVKHIYAATGNYNVKLIANFGACTDSITKVFTVTDKPTASFTSTGNRATCAVPSTIQFQNTSTNGVSYVWKFGDGGQSNQASPSYNYTKGGFFDVSLVAINSNGCSDTLVSPRYVQLGPPKIDSLKGAPISGCVGSTINFAAAISSGDPISSYKWAFGDGGTSTTGVATHAYASPGSYTVTLDVTTNSGCKASAKFANMVRVGNKPVAKFFAPITNACASQPVQFNDQSTGNITDWVWNFGDNGPGSGVQNPSYLYADTGYFTISLKVGSNGCYDQAQKVNYIHVNSPVAKFGYKYQCGNRLIRNFVDSSIAAKTWNWDFGDGGKSTVKNPSYTYQKSGTYYVTLTVTNGACSSTVTDTLDVVDQLPTFTYSPANTQLCKYDSVTFVTKFDPTFATSFSWNFGDGTTTAFNIRYSTITHAFKNAGNFSPQVIMKDVLGCYDTAKVTGLQFNVFGPRANFTNTTGTCVKGSIQFVDKSTPDSVPHAIQQWIWDYGDGTTQTLSGLPFQHTYNVAGVYDVKLKVVDSYGCYDTVVHFNADTIAHPVADFASLDATRCSVSGVVFADSSKGITLTYLWNFGDKQTSTQPSPQHVYDKAGAYTVSLKVIDRFGCSDSITKVNFVRISNPKASFSIADTVHYCPPWEITPKNTSKSYTFLTWEFGDNNSSNLTNPKHTYIGAGTYQLLLIAQGHGDCYDTARKTLTVLGPSATLSYSNRPQCVPATIDFKATGHNVAGYQWFFGDGQLQSSQTPDFSYTYTTAGKYLPSLTVIDSTGTCAVQVKNDLDSIRIVDVAVKFGAATSPGCDSALVSFTDSSQIFFDGLASRTWDFGDGKTSIAKNPVHYYSKTATTNVSLVFVTVLGCTDTFKLPVNIIVNQAPVLKAAIPASVCINSQANFTSSNSSVPPGTIKWFWQFGDGSTDTLQNPTYTYTTAGPYNPSVIATNEFGCADTIQSAITVQPLPTVDAGLDSVICLGQSVNLQPTGAATYVWSPGTFLNCTNCNTPTAQPDSTTRYYVTGTSAAGCINFDSILIQVKRPITVSLQPVDTLCIGNTIQLSASGAEVYNWAPSTGLSSIDVNDPVATPSVSTTYTVIGTDTKRCFSDTKSVVVQVYPNPAVSIAANAATIMEGGTYTPASTTSPDVVKWQWLPPDGLSCNSCAVPTAKPRVTTTYTETVYNQYGCTDTASVTITVLCNEKSIYIPNTFSPNGDGMNDYFYPRGVGIYTIRAMRIFNRWGKIVFEKMNFAANDISKAWDGKLGGVAQPSDVYVYVMEIECDNGTVITSKGDVTLLR